MPYQPTFPIPHLTSIDVDNPETCFFSCVVNPRDVVVGYVVRIYDATTKKTVAFIRCGNNKKEYYINKSKDDLEYDPFLSFVTIEDTLNNSDSPLPVHGNSDGTETLRLFIPKEILDVMDNNKSYIWKIALECDGTSLNKVSTGTAGAEITNPANNFYADKNIISLYDFYNNKLKLKHLGIFYDIDSVKWNSSYNKDTAQNSILQLSGGFVVPQNDSYEIYTNVVYSQDFYFYTAKAPTLEFIDPPELVRSFSHTFNAEWSSGGNQKIDSYRFKLYLSDTLLDDTNKIYSSNIQYTYDKFETGKSYTLDLEVEDEYRNIDTISLSFDVEFATNTIPLTPKITCDATGVVELDFSELVSIVGHGTGLENIDNGIVSIPDNGFIIWNKTQGGKDIQIPYESTTILKVRLHSLFEGDIFAISNTQNIYDKITIWFDGTSFVWRNGTESPKYIGAYDKVVSAIVDEAEYNPDDFKGKNINKYIIEANDEVSTTDYIIANDDLSKWWWYIIIRPRAETDKVKIIRGEGC